MAVCFCCHNLVAQLEEQFKNGNDEHFFQLWTSLADKPKSSYTREEADFSLLVRFKLQVYFAVVKLSPDSGNANGGKSMEKFVTFLRENGSNYSQLAELAPYFALPYIVTNQNHPLLLEVRSTEWLKELDAQWKELLKQEVHHSHGFNEKRIEIQSRRYTRLKAKYAKLFDDHKMLLGLATRLVTALENSVHGDTKSAVETFAFYRQEIKQFSEKLEETSHTDKKEGSDKQEVGFQWEARVMARSPSLESIGSKHSLEHNQES